ncbi:hypothetical protein C8J57DRAFT_1730108 [Mycena rebaudengoi]|nr:hypothetical protein C8J57DRAFT_1730108 [Mycena rebaudengoi]
MTSGRQSKYRRQYIAVLERVSGAKYAGAYQLKNDHEKLFGLDFDRAIKYLERYRFHWGRTLKEFYRLAGCTISTARRAPYSNARNPEDPVISADFRVTVFRPLADTLHTAAKSARNAILNVPERMEERRDPGNTPHQRGQFLDGAAKLLGEFGQALKDEPGMVQEGPRSVTEEEFWDGLRKKFEAELKEQERQEWM